MAKRKQDQSPTILKSFRLASPKENVGSSSEWGQVGRVGDETNFKDSSKWWVGQGVEFVEPPKFEGWLRA